MSAVLPAPPATSSARDQGGGSRLGRLRIAGLVLGLFVLSVAPRTIGLGLFVTPDEDNWMRRAGNFARAFERGRLEQTYQSGHPGVTTMWLALIGVGPEISSLAGTTAESGPVTNRPEFMRQLVKARLAFVVANSALAVVLTLLICRLVGTGPGVLAGVLIALDPFLVAHSQVVHLDALSAGLISVAVLAGSIYWSGGSRGYLGLCAVASGLAVLTKAPSVFLVPFLPILAFGARLSCEGWRSWRSQVAPVLASLLVAGVGAAAIMFLCWPSLWVAPIATIAQAIEYTRQTAGTPHGPGNFFLGQPTPDPGWLFYVYATAFRVSPLTLLGLAALAVVLPPASVRRQTVLLLGFVLGFGLFLGLASKKLDRYALPVFPAVSALAAIGLWTVWKSAWPRVDRTIAMCALGLVVLVQGALLASVYPYALAYYNPLLGGAQVAQRVILVGWGEGLDQAAAYLNAQPDATTSRIAVYYPLVLNFQGMVTGAVQPYGARQPANYVVDYVNAAQRGQTPPEVRGLAPSHTVEINGIAYAMIYRLEPARRVTQPRSTATGATR